MQELIKRQQQLRTRKIICHSVIAIHTYILPMLSCPLIVASYGINHIFTMIGFAIALYAVAVGGFFAIPWCGNWLWDINKNLKQNADRIEFVTDINRQLDECSDRLLFDGDNSYWQILERLATDKCD